MKTILECSSTPTPTPTPTTTPITTAVTEIEGKGWVHTKINEMGILGFKRIRTRV